MKHEESIGKRFLEETIGIPIDIISNDYEEFPAIENTVNTYQGDYFPDQGR